MADIRSIKEIREHNAKKEKFWSYIQTNSWPQLLIEEKFKQLLIRSCSIRRIQRRGTTTTSIGCRSEEHWIMWKGSSRWREPTSTSLFEWKRDEGYTQGTKSRLSRTSWWRSTGSIHSVRSSRIVRTLESWSLSFIRSIDNLLFFIVLLFFSNNNNKKICLPYHFILSLINFPNLEIQKEFINLHNGARLHSHWSRSNPKESTCSRYQW